MRDPRGTYFRYPPVRRRVSRVGGDLRSLRGALFSAPRHDLGRARTAGVLLWAQARGGTRVRGRNDHIAEIESGVYTSATLRFRAVACGPASNYRKTGPLRARSDDRKGGVRLGKATRLGQLIAAFFLSRAGGSGRTGTKKAVRVRRRQEGSVLARRRLAESTLASTRMFAHLCTPVYVERTSNHA